MKLKLVQGMGKVAAMLPLAAGPLWAGTEGVSSTFYGQGAGFSNSNGGDSGANTFIGLSAGTNNATGSLNTFVGTEAGHYNTTGPYNTFVGMDAGYSNTTGSANTFLGTTAGHDNTTGHDNTFLGVGAGTYNTTGQDNTFVGTEAGIYNTTGQDNTFVGLKAGYSNTTGSANTLLGWAAGVTNSTGDYNTVVGNQAGYTNSTGQGNTYLGYGAGFNSTSGSHNVFIGVDAGYSEQGSNKLYIDTCYSNVPCDSPLIYGEFDNHLLTINGVTHVAANGVAKSQMHFSLDNGDYGGFLTSVLPNNFFVSSGARYDSGNWVQRSADGNAVMAGSGGAGYRIFTHTGGTVGTPFSNLDLRLQIDYSGQFGINHTPVAGDEIHTSSGAHLTSGGVWTDASSREYKEDIHPLTTAEAQQTLAALDPVRYRYKVNPEEKHVGFIAEDVPELVARKDRKSLSPMDIVAVLTKVVQEQRQQLDAMRAELDSVKAKLGQSTAVSR